MSPGEGHPNLWLARLDAADPPASRAPALPAFASRTRLSPASRAPRPSPAVPWSSGLSFGSGRAFANSLEGALELEDVNRQLRDIVSTIPAGDRDFMLHVLTADEAGRAETIGNLHATGLTPATVEFLIDAEEDRPLRALLVGLLREVAWRH